MRILAALALGAVALAGCATVPADGTGRAAANHCRAEPGQRFVGQRATGETGAAILAYLCGKPSAPGRRILKTSSHGFGSKRLPGVSNCLRLLAFERREPGQQRAADRHRRTKHRGQLAPAQQPALVDGLRRAACTRLEQLAGRIDVVHVRADDLRGRVGGEAREQFLDALRVARVVAREADEDLARPKLREFRQVGAQAEVARRAARASVRVALVVGSAEAGAADALVPDVRTPDVGTPHVRAPGASVAPEVVELTRLAGSPEASLADPARWLEAAAATLAART